MQWIYGADWIHSFIVSGVTYLVCALGPRKHQHKIVFLWAMGYMTGCHVYKMYTSYLTGITDFTGTHMVLTMKLTKFAYNLYDGTVDYKNVFPDTPYEDKRKAKIYQDRQKVAITKLPSLLEYFGHIYCFTTLIAGPCVDYSVYAKAVEGSLFNTNQPGKQPKPDHTNLGLSLLSFCQAVVALVIYVVLGAQFPVATMYSKAFIETVPFMQKVVYLYAVSIRGRCSYYFCWKMSEGSCLLSGFGFEGYDPDTGASLGWGGASNVDILGAELEVNVQGVTRAWNKKTQSWLEQYTYLRTNKSLVATYFVSAFWHGVYPGYYVFFMSVPLVTVVERALKAQLTPLLLPDYTSRGGYGGVSRWPRTLREWAYYTACFVLTRFALTYYSQGMLVYSLERSIVLLANFYYLPHIACVVMYFVLRMTATFTKKSEKDKQQ